MLKQEKSLIRRVLPHLLAIIAFAAVTMLFFSPLVQGKAMKQHDVTQFKGSAQELIEYYNNEGEGSSWTGSMFSGMPAYQIGVWGGSPNFLDYVERPIRLIAGGIAAPMFIGMCMSYILFLLMGCRPAVAVAGAIAYSLSSYNIIILGAGHITKAWTIAYMPLIIAGMMVMFRRKYLLGGILMALGLALQLKNNHMQMTYYTGILCAFLFLALAVDFIRKKEFKGLIKASSILAFAVILGALANYSSIYNNYLMAEESIRGESELTENKIASETGKKTSGLDKDYVFGWSYGKAETLSFLVPNIHGGVSKAFDQDTEPIKLLSKYVQSGQMPKETAEQIHQVTTEYWGDQPMTSGPVYLGAIVCFLFVLGMFTIRSKMKWVLFAATIFFIFLGLGKNLEWFNDPFFYHFPLYNKFRAVSSALVIPALTMVIVAIWGLNDFFARDTDKQTRSKMLYIALGITGGLCLVLWMAPGAFFDFMSARDQQIGLNGIPDFYKAVLETRKTMLASDALRSLGFILLTAAILWFSLRTKLDKQKISIGASLAIALLILIDFWGVDKRFLNDSHYENKAKQKKEEFATTNADKFILQDPHPSYRVLNTGNPFSEAGTSYHHKSIGGYSAVKLKRYQELIDYYLGSEAQYIGGACNQQVQSVVKQLQEAGIEINPTEVIGYVQESVAPALENTTILNMLNTKYIIYNPQLAPLVNPHAMGNAWFVSDYSLVDNADEEMAALKDLEPKQHAIIDKRFEEELKGLQIVPDSTASIELITYKPNRLIYKSKANSEQLAIFSEIYFAEGWEASIDGKLIPHFRADWTLRAMRVPAGEHEVKFEFIPHGYLNARMVMTASSGILILLVLGGFGFLIIKRKEA